MTNFEKFKNREFLGDKLLDVIVSDILISKGKSRNEVNRLLSSYTSTVFLCTVFDKLGIVEHEHDKSDRESKRKANAVEEYIFTEFIKNGYLQTRDLFSSIIFD